MRSGSSHASIDARCPPAENPVAYTREASMHASVPNSSRRAFTNATSSTSLPSGSHPVTPVTSSLSPTTRPSGRTTMNPSRSAIALSPSVDSWTDGFPLRPWNESTTGRGSVLAVDVGECTAAVRRAPFIVTSTRSTPVRSIPAPQAGLGFDRGRGRVHGRRTGPWPQPSRHLRHTRRRAAGRPPASPAPWTRIGHAETSSWTSDLFGRSMARSGGTWLRQMVRSRSAHHGSRRSLLVSLPASLRGRTGWISKLRGTLYPASRSRQKPMTS